MKKLLIPLAMLLSMVVAPAQNSASDVTVKGRLPRDFDGIALMVARISEDGLQTIATANVDEGKFRFTVPVRGEVERLALHSLDDERISPQILYFWAAPGKEVRIEGADGHIAAWRVVSDIPEQREENFYNDAERKSTARGSRVRIELHRLNKNKPSNLGEACIIAAICDSLEHEYNLADLDQTLAALEVLKQRDFNDIWLNNYASTLGFLSQPDDDIAALIPDVSLTDVAGLYGRIPAAALDTEKGREIRSLYEVLVATNKAVVDRDNITGIEPIDIVKEGAPAPEIDLVDLDGNPHRLAEFRGKYILLDFWAHWCGPCCAAMPEMAEVGKLYGDRLALVSICRDKEEQWRRASEKHGITWNNFNITDDGEQTWASYRVEGIPHYVLISPEGDAITWWTGYGPGILKSSLAQYLK